MSYRDNTIDDQRAKAWSNKITKHIKTAHSIFIPINHNQNHWLLIHVDIKHKQIQQIDSLKTYTTKNYAIIIQEYLARISNTQNEEWQTIQENTPQQTNGPSS